MKVCRTCGKNKPLSDFTVRSSDGWVYVHCKACISAKAKAKRDEERKNRPERKRYIIEGNCAFDGCGRKAKTRITGIGGPEGFYCGVHYNQWSRNKQLKPIGPYRVQVESPSERYCTACQTTKSISEFYKRAGGGGFQTQCKPCFMKVTRCNLMISRGEWEEALEIALSMAVGARNYYVGRVATQKKEAENG